jgi:hypothetical protein
MPPLSFLMIVGYSNMAIVLPEDALRASLVVVLTLRIMPH